MLHERNLGKGIGVTVGVNVVSGMLAGTVATVVSQPFDLIKTRRMTTDGRDASGLQSLGAAGRGGTLQSVRSTVATEGFSSLWKGLVRGARVPAHIAAQTHLSCLVACVFVSRRCARA